MTPPEPAPRHALDRERAHHDRCRTALAAMADGADERVGTGEDVSASGADAEVRGDLGLPVCVQGAPGTGKTAVGLHRAAYLLYTHPQCIRRGGLLVLGPSRTFLSCVSEVLPALGETGVRQSTLVEEIARHPVTGTDDERAAVVKRDVRMAGVLRRALYVVLTRAVSRLEVVRARELPFRRDVSGGRAPRRPG